MLQNFSISTMISRFASPSYCTTANTGYAGPVMSPEGKPSVTATVKFLQAECLSFQPTSNVRAMAN